MMKKIPITKEIISQALLLMTKKQRQAVSLKLKGLTQKEIAKKLGKTQPAISMLINSGTQRAKIFFK